MKSDVLPTDPPLTDPTLAETAVPTPTETFQSDQVFTIAGAHFAHDTFSAFLAPLLPLLQERLNTNYALTGGLTIYSQLPSLLNPFIGYLADKVSLRYFIIFAPAVTATLMSSMGFTSNYLTLALLLLAAGVSIAAFHSPAPAMVGRVSGRQVGKGMSIFMASGELGRTLGPVIAVAAVNQWALEVIWRLAFVGWAVSGILYLRLRNISARPMQKDHAALSAFWPKARRIFTILTWIMVARVFMLVALTTYLPIFMRDVRESTLWLAAASLTILEAAGVVGALLTGTLSDRVGRRRMLTFLLGMAPLLLVAFLYSPGWLLIPLLLGLGLTAITTQPVLLAVVQDEFPQHRALANGTFLGISFLVRAGAVWIVGMWADRFGLTQAFLWSGLAAWVSLPAIWLLPQRAKIG